MIAENSRNCDVFDPSDVRFFEKYAMELLKCACERIPTYDMYLRFAVHINHMKNLKMFRSK